MIFVRFFPFFPASGRKYRILTMHKKQSVKNANICKHTILRYARNERVATMDELKEFRDLPAMDYNDTDLDEKEWIKTCCDWCLTAQNHCLTNDARLIFIFKINLNLPTNRLARSWA